MASGIGLRTVSTTATTKSSPLFKSPVTHQQRRKRKKSSSLSNKNNRTITLCLSVFLCTFIFLYLVGILLFLPWSSSAVPADSSSPRKLSIDKERVKNIVKNAFKRKPNKAEQVFEDTLQQFQIDRDNAGIQQPINTKFEKKKNLRIPLNQNQNDKKENVIVTPPNGVMVLGMHRSGTSMLSGLLVKGLGYETGGPLIGQSFDNKKGFFERIDIVLQNDEFLEKQGANWDRNVNKYDNKKAYQMKLDNKLKWKEGQKGLTFLNDKSKSPWLQKDPRMCLTLSTWLPMLSALPAIIFTYRHPLQVALSLRKRNKTEGFPHFPLEKGFRLWIIYNVKAIQQSHHLCKVYTSNDAVLKNPKVEVQRISNELTNKCKLKSPPHKQISNDILNTFVDPKLQHSKNTGDKILMTFNDGNCPVYDYEREYTDKNSEQYLREYDLYVIAMKIYCDFENGSAYHEDYGFPELPK